MKSLKQIGTCYNVPIKNKIQPDGEIEGFVYQNRMIFERCIVLQESDLEPKSALLNTFDSLHINPEAISKYRNAVDFYDSTMSEQKKRQNSEKMNFE